MLIPVLTADLAVKTLHHQTLSLRPVSHCLPDDVHHILSTFQTIAVHATYHLPVCTDHIAHSSTSPMLTHFPASAHAFFFTCTAFPWETLLGFPSRTSSHSMSPKKPSSVPLARRESLHSVLPHDPALPSSNGPILFVVYLLVHRLSRLHSVLSFSRAGAVRCPLLTECVAAQNDARCFYKIK